MLIPAIETCFTALSAYRSLPWSIFNKCIAVAMVANEVANKMPLPMLMM